jgi:hypothetical protein
MKYLKFKEYDNDSDFNFVKNHIIIKRYLKTEFKRNNPINLKREDIII